jgi:antitoxin Phd
MPSASRSPKKKAQQPATGIRRWKLEDAKARFSEVVRLAATAGPQLVTVRGKEAAVILAPEKYRQLLPAPPAHVPLHRFLRDLGLRAIDVEREYDPGRDVDL